MADGIGLSIGAAHLTVVHVGRAAVTRSAVLTRYPHRPSEVGVPSENVNLAERGLVLTDFVDRVGDPVPMIAPDGSAHRAEAVLADALRALLHALPGGRPPSEPIAVAHPAHWGHSAVEALRGALTAVAEFRAPLPVLLLPDATAALTALQHEPGVPARGVIALCDFGATGTSITLADAANGFRSAGPTVRYEELSGELIDQALLTRVLAGSSAQGSVDLAGTSAIGSLSRLRSQCRSAKERLSTTTVTSLPVALPGVGNDVRVTRTELDEAVRGTLDGFVVELQNTLQRNGIRGTDLVAVATVGGGARIPIVTTTLSEHFRVPVITAPAPELAAGIGGGLRAVRGTVVENATSMAPAAVAGAAVAGAAVAVPSEAPASSTFRALAWSDADDTPDVAPSPDYDADAYTGYGDADAPAEGSARPQLDFGDREAIDDDAAAVPWYRRPAVIAGIVLAVGLVAVAGAIAFVLRDTGEAAPTGTTTPASTSPTTVTTTTAEEPPPASSEPAPTSAPGSPTVTRRAPTQQAPQRDPAPSEADPPPSSEEPPPSSEEPPPSSAEPPPASQEPVVPTLPYETIPGLPFVPSPFQPQQP